MPIKDVDLYLIRTYANYAWVVIMNASTLHRLAAILVKHVQTASPDDRTVTYGEVSRIFGGINPRNLNQPLGAICEVSKELGFPALSAIVVNKDTQIPGEGFYQYVGELYTGKAIQPTDWLDFWEAQIGQIYAREDWDRFLAEFHKVRL